MQSYHDSGYEGLLNPKAPAAVMPRACSGKLGAKRQQRSTDCFHQLLLALFAPLDGCPRCLASSPTLLNFPFHSQQLRILDETGEEDYGE